MKGGADMKKAFFSLMIAMATVAAAAAPYRVALVVQNRSTGFQPPMSAFADALTACSINASRNTISLLAL